MSKNSFNITPPPSEMEKRDEVLAKAYSNLIYFGRAFLPNDFLKKSESAPFHYEMAKKMIDTAPGARICNIIPRGHGKSVIAKAAIMHKLCFAREGDQHFIAWVSEEQSQAIDHLKYIRSHFENNKMIKYYFGNMDGGTVGKRWTEKDLVTPKGDRVISKGT